MTPMAVARCVARARDARASSDQRHAAFGELVAAFETMAFRSALRSLRDPDEARDASQEALFAAWSKLEQLRVPESFGGWLKRLVHTECGRRLRTRLDFVRLTETPLPGDVDDRQAPCRPLARAVGALSESERRALILFHVFGYKIREIATMTGAPPATIGKRLYTARLKLRRRLPPSVRAEVLQVGTPARGIRTEVLGDYVGEYRFEERPDVVVQITRHRGGDFLISRSRGQRSRLFMIGADALGTVAFDGEGRFQRNGRGEVTHFDYYEFGARLGVARKVDPLVALRNESPDRPVTAGSRSARRTSP